MGKNHARESLITSALTRTQVSPRSREYAAQPQQPSSGVFLPPIFRPPESRLCNSQQPIPASPGE